MRVVLPALFDAFECADADCACRRARRAAPLSKPLPEGRFPFRDAEQRLLRGAQALAGGAAPHGGPVTGFPIAAVATPNGAELYFSTLCPVVRRLLAANLEAIDLARVEGGWRTPLQAFQPADGGKLVQVSAKYSLPWRSFQALRERLLDLVADPTHLPFARLARVAALVDQVITEQAAAVQVPPLTARDFLAFRGWFEGRVAATDGTAMAQFAARAMPLWPEAGEVAGGGPWQALLDGDWRGQWRRWLVPAESSLAPVFEACLAVRMFAIPLERDQTLQRGYAELFEGLACGLRFAAAMAAAAGAPVTPVQLVAGLTLGEAMVADAAAPLPLYARPEGSHDRGPRMADLDMTLESIC